MASEAAPGEAPPLLAVRGLKAYYDQFEALHGVDIMVGQGEIVSIIGANGAGKSSLLKSILGQVDRVEGEISLAGEPILGRSTAAIVASGVALVPEGRRLFPSLSVEENLWIGWDVGRRDGMTFEEIYDLFPALRERRHAAARLLSGGQQQMVAVGRALLAGPRLLLCDEISLGLAPVVVSSLYELIPRVRARGIGVLLVEQDISRSLAVSDRFYCLLEGHVSLAGRPAEADHDTVMKHYFGL